MKFIFALFMLTFSTITFAATDMYYDQYPVGYISENSLYDLVNQNREKFRQCHLDYLKKLPGGFDSLSLEFQIDPQGYAKPLKTGVTPGAKDDALKCLKSLVRSLKFPIPAYGIVFARFDSDVDMQNVNTIPTLELSRSAITMVPYMPQKIMNAVADMYMPYYRGCFGKPYVENEKAKPGEITTKWNVSEEGRAVDIQIDSTIDNEKMKQCLTQVTQQQRYPAGYLKTPIERKFKLHKVFN